MGIADDGLTIPTPDLSTDDGKNTHAAMVVKHSCNRIIRDCCRLVDSMNETISLAPGDKATVMAKIDAEAQTVMDLVLSIFNTHKPTAETTRTFDGNYP